MCTSKPQIVDKCHRKRRSSKAEQMKCSFTGAPHGLRPVRPQDFPIAMVRRTDGSKTLRGAGVCLFVLTKPALSHAGFANTQLRFSLSGACAGCRSHTDKTNLREIPSVIPMSRSFPSSVKVSPCHHSKFYNGVSKLCGRKTT